MGGLGTGADSPGSAVPPPEGAGRGLGELVLVATVLSPGEEGTQLRVHVAEDEGQPGQLSPASMGSEGLGRTSGLALAPATPFGGIPTGPRTPDSVPCPCRVR